MSTTCAGTNHESCITRGGKRWVKATLVLLALISGGSAMSQTAASAPTSAPDGAPRIGDPDYGKSEKAIRAADSPLRWIKLHAEGPQHPLQKAVTVPPPMIAPLPTVKATRSAAKPASTKTTVTATAGSPGQPGTTTPPAEPADAVSAAATTPQQAAAEEVPDLVFAERAEPAWEAATMTKLRVARVEVRFDVAVDGHTSAPRIVSSTNKQLDKTALDTIRKWRFEPISKPRSATVEFGFDLNAGSDEAPSAELIAIDQPDPEWGDPLMQKLRKGQAQVRVSVGTDGRLTRVEMINLSNALLADPITAALKLWRFRPLEKSLTATIEFGFDLDRNTR